MIIDSHAHYAHARYDVEFPYLSYGDSSYEVCRADRENLFLEMQKKGIVGVIEPSIGFENIEKQMALVAENPDFMRLSLGVHPTRCFRTDWKNRKKLKYYAENASLVAIGETGLDYHYKREEQHRWTQKRWFVYQIKLADRLGLPLVLHIRNADNDALKILKRYQKKLHGGVVHCFSGDFSLAEKYISLGFALGIGGKLLCKEDAAILSETVKRVPLSSLLLETDAPFVLPDTEKGLCTGNQRKKLCNSSCILPCLLETIADLRGESRAFVEETIYRNTRRIFYQ